MRRPSNQSIGEFGELFEPSEAAEPILSKPVRGALLEWLTEIFASDELQKLNIGPRRRAIFDGPPGVGKTTLAHHLSARLGLPMLAVRPERVISRYVGATGENIGQLFDVVEAQLEAGEPVVLFLDEFDALGISRHGDTDQASDRDRAEYINILLQRLERYKGLAIAATNFGERIDPAMWRRFDMHIRLELPGQFEREQILKRYLAPLGLPQPALTLLAEAMNTASPALMRQFCEHFKRIIVIGPKLNQDMSKRAVLGRLVTTIQPHPSLGKPAMWATVSKDHARDRAIDAMPWPLPQAIDLPSEERSVRTEPGAALGARR